MAENSVHLELRGIRKAFGALLANDGVSFAVQRGAIHAIVGENGAGKSTAMKVLFGQYAPDSGEIWVDGQARRWKSSADAIAAGLGMVHQHFMLAGSHSALENVLLAAGGPAITCLALGPARARLEALMREFHMEVRLDVPVSELSVGEQQRVEILKLLYCDSQILILDEPTAVLAPGEIAALFSTLRGMAARGKTILIITHKLKEVMTLAHRVTVFRAGRVAGELDIASTSVPALAKLMVGRELQPEDKEERLPVRRECVLEWKAVQPVPALQRLESISFRLHAGEVLGIAGVDGNGQTELIRLLLDPRHRLAKGEYWLGGNNVSRWSALRLRDEAKLAVFPEDRLREALLLQSSAEENFLLGQSRNPLFRRWGVFLDRASLRTCTGRALREFDVRPPEPRTRAGAFSGGNQQKLVVARALSSQPRFLIAAQPTRGVDIGAIEFIHSQILALRNSGSGVLLVSSELEEVLKLSDRLLVLYRGRVVGSFLRSEFDEQKIGLLMAGGGAVERSTG